MTRSDNRLSSFQLNPSFQNPLYKALFTIVRSPLERMLALHRLAEIYEQIPPSGSSGDFVDQTLKAFGVGYEVDSSDLLRIPKDGPIVLVANHPFGGLEGLIMASVLKKIRPDLKIMANFILRRVPELRDLFIFVDPFGRENSKSKNIRPLRETIEWVKAGGALVVFPAGTVSHLHLQRGQVEDPEWSDTVARVIRKTGAPALPVFFLGSNSVFFQLLGLVHPSLRTAMLPHELLNKRNKTVKLAIGNVIPNDKLISFSTDDELVSYLRLHTYILRSCLRRDKSMRRITPAPRKLLPLVPPKDQELLQQEVSSLDASQLLMSNGDWQVYCAPSQQIPHILFEIGRLREATFRPLGEGTGKSIDLDEYDAHYLHLFVWNSSMKEVIGAYRLGLSDEILSHLGVAGLYTSTLFAYPVTLLEQIGPALELGRSFIRAEYQRNYLPLLLLWKGIGCYVAQNPQYKILFGPVTINNNYNSISRQLMVDFLRSNQFLPDLGALVKAKHPLRKRRRKALRLRDVSTAVRSIEEVSALVGQIENAQRGIPVLLRQYLKLGGKLLGFNIDPDFGYVVDGLILVDLTKTETRLLERYLGEEGAARFLAFHQEQEGQRQAPDK